MRDPCLFFLAAGLALGTGACTSVSVYQSAKTLPKGTMQAGIGVGGGAAKNKTRIPGFNPEFPSLSGDIWARYGFTNRVDGGIKLSLFGSLTGDARYGLLNERRGDKLSLAAGLSYVYTNASSSGLGQADKTVIQDLMLPLYISKDLADWFTVYAVPRYVRRATGNRRTYAASPALSENINSNMLGLGGGIMFNLGARRGSHLALEFHKVFDPADPSHYTQNGGLALAFDF
ncbi:MAG TPA: hypothetical protein PKI19_10360 [Elusimicrobiales bacterium]|nr:hypothetical protein [Elusimicrobiales bacterium]